MVIYKITNLLNEKIYIGQTKQTIERRYIQHSKANSPLGQAMRECGIENFTIEIIERCENQNELNEREKFWIKVLKSKSPNGYNLSNGGEGFIKEKNSSNNSVVMILATKLKRLRFEKDITQAEFAREIGVAQQTVGSWEKGNSAPNYDTLNKIADYFNVSADYLLGRKSANKISLSREQKNLLNGFDGLNDEGKKAIMILIGQLNFSRASTPTTALAV